MKLKDLDGVKISSDIKATSGTVVGDFTSRKDPYRVTTGDRSECRQLVPVLPSAGRSEMNEGGTFSGTLNIIRHVSTSVTSSDADEDGVEQVELVRAYAGVKRKRNLRQRFFAIGSEESVGRGEIKHVEMNDEDENNTTTATTTTTTTTTTPSKKKHKKKHKSAKSSKKHKSS